MELDRDELALLEYINSFAYVSCETVTTEQVWLYGDVYVSPKLTRKLVSRGMIELVDITTKTRPNLLVYSLTKRGKNYLKGMEGI